MEVIAVKRGYYNGLKEIGQKFKLISNLPKGSKKSKTENIEQQFCSLWMEKVIKKPEAKKSGKIQLSKN